jgi:hypothetical protein
MGSCSAWIWKDAELFIHFALSLNFIEILIFLILPAVAAFLATSVTGWTSFAMLLLRTAGPRFLDFTGEIAQLLFAHARLGLFALAQAGEFRAHKPSLPFRLAGHQIANAASFT